MAFRAVALEEQGELQLEEDDGVNRGTAMVGVAGLDPVAYTGQVEGRVEMAVEVIAGDELLEGRGDRAIECPQFGRTEHRGGRLSSGDGQQHSPDCNTIPRTPLFQQFSTSLRATIGG